jgi:hypothetical protein
MLKHEFGTTCDFHRESIEMLRIDHLRQEIIQP